MPNTGRCRSDHAAIIGRHLREMVAEILAPFEGQTFSPALFCEAEEELDALADSLRAYAEAFGVPGVWPEFYDRGEET